VSCLGLEGQVPEKWYTSVPDQRAHAEETLAIFDAVFATKTLAELKAMFDEAGVWYQPILRTQVTVLLGKCFPQLLFCPEPVLAKDRFA
jgi:crotonobetainyl-CoA:carnitine CoA-transferase CaiB-like acyl-CoA transferase